MTPQGFQPGNCICIVLKTQKFLYTSMAQAALLQIAPPLNEAAPMYITLTSILALVFVLSILPLHMLL